MFHLRVYDIYLNASVEKMHQFTVTIGFNPEFIILQNF